MSKNSVKQLPVAHGATNEHGVRTAYHGFSPVSFSFNHGSDSQSLSFVDLRLSKTAIRALISGLGYLQAALLKSASRDNPIENGYVSNTDRWMFEDYSRMQDFLESLLPVDPETGDELPF